MYITSKEIRKNDFKKNFRGYDTVEVDAFLETVSSHYDTLLTEIKTLNDKIKSLSSDISIYRENEQNLQRALIKAQNLGEEIVESAKKKSELIIKEAELDANKMKQNVDDELINKRQELDEYKYKNDKLMDDVKIFLIDKLNELENFIRNKKIIKMELTNIHHDTDEQEEEKEAVQEKDGNPKAMKKITVSSFTTNEDNKSFDDNFEVKK
jgi:cell division initiation protein